MVAINLSSFGSVSLGPVSIGGSASHPSVSASGRYVTFRSWASDMTGAVDDNALPDIFLRDLASGVVTLVSGRLAIAGNSESTNSAVSADGKVVAFDSASSNLVINETGTTYDVFVRDIVWNRTIRISSGTDGGQGNGPSHLQGLSSDGRHVLFQSHADNLVEGDINARSDVFMHDRLSGATQLVSVSTAGVQGNGDSTAAAMSSDGRFVTFTSDATNLVDGDHNGSEVFLHDMLEGTTRRVALSTAGVEANADSSGGVVSRDGRFVVFESAASNLVANDTNGVVDVFLRDTVANTTIRLSQFHGVQGNGASMQADISDDGRYVVFASQADNLVQGDANGRQDIFLRDLVGGTLSLVSIGQFGQQGNQDSHQARISDDGKHIVFSSSATSFQFSTLQSVYRISLVASEAADNLIGTTGNDIIAGLAGNDIIDGGPGADKMNGGPGNDTIYVDHASDTVIESVGEGADTVIASANFTLMANAEVEYLRAADPGEVVARNLVGNNFGQFMFGTAGVNALDARGGNDRMWGGLGNDSFIFSSALNQSTNVDRIEDFSNAPGNDDRIMLDDAVFTQLTTGWLNPAFLAANASGLAVDADDRIVYNTTSGQLFYDMNGVGAGGVTYFGLLVGAPTITAADFLIF